MVVLFIIFAVVCYIVGTSKGYNGIVCAVAGFFGNLLALIVLFLLPDKAEAQIETQQLEAEISALKQRIAELETALREATAPDAPEPESTTSSDPAAPDGTPFLYENE